MWYIIIGVAALLCGLLVGIYIGRWKCKPLPLFEKELAKKRAEYESELDKMMKAHQERIEALRSNNETALAAIKNQHNLEINKIQQESDLKIQELQHNVELAINNQAHSIELGVASRKNEIERNIRDLENRLSILRLSWDDTSAAFDEWKHNMMSTKNTMLGIRKMEREAELTILEHTYEERRAAVESAIQIIQNTLDLWSNTERAAYEEREGRKAAEEKNKLALSDRSIAELHELYEACGKLSLANPTPLFKAIYEIYLRGPVKDLGTRILGSKTVTGIYKIWNVDSGKVYVGQSVDIAERWKQHIKRGVKCEMGTIVGASLYAAMWDEGIWNFRFEVLEECDKGILNEREKFWINYYQSNVIGYNQKL